MPTAPRRSGRSPSSRGSRPASGDVARIAAPCAGSGGKLDVGLAAAPARGLGERVLEPAVADVVAEREQRRRLPEEPDQRRLRGEARLGRLREQHDVAGLPAAGHEPHVGHEPDAADDRRRRDRAPVGVVVERHVSRHDRNAERLGRARDSLDRLRELVRDLGLLGIAEVEAVGQADRLAAGARDVARRAEHGLHARRERIALARPRPLQRHGEPAQRRPQAQHARVEPRPAHRARADELVVLLRDPRLVGAVRVAQRRRRLRARSPASPARPRSAGTRRSGTTPGSSRPARRRRARAARRDRSPRRSACSRAPSARTPLAPRRASAAARPRPSAPATRRS